jgi:GAF domain-containing protein/CheY-like chemotaxis protein
MTAKDERQRTRELEVLAESSRLLTSTLDLGEVLARLADIARARVGVDVVRIWLLEESGDALRLRAQTGIETGAARVPEALSRRGSLAGWVLTHRTPLCLADLQRDPRLSSREFVAAEGLASALAVPIMRDATAIGVLACMSRSRREFNEADVAIAEALTAPAVVAVRNAALYQDALNRVEEIQAYQRVASETLSSPDLETVLHAVLREIQGLLRSDAAGCSVQLPTSPELRSVTTAGTRTAGIPNCAPRSGEGLIGLVLKERRPLRTDDYLGDPRLLRTPEVDAWARAEDVRAMIAAPVIGAGGEVIAFLWAFNRMSAAFTPRDEAMLAGLAQQAALAIGKAHGLEQERQRAAQTAALLEVARACTSTLLLHDIAMRTAQAVGTERCGIYIWNGGRLSPVMGAYADGRRDRTMWRRFKSLGDRPMQDVPAHARAIRQRQPVLVSRGSDLLPADWFDAFELNSSLVVPLVSNDAVVGTISLDDREPPRRWRQDQLDLVMTIAAQIALAIDTARHYEEARQRASEVEALSAMGETLTSTLDLQQVLERIADSAATLIGSRRAVVFELDAQAGCVRARAVRGVDVEPGFTLPLGQGAAGLAASRRAPVWRADLLADPLPGYDLTHQASGQRLGDLVRRLRFRGVLAVPVVSRDTALGAVSIYWDDVHQPDSREIRLLTALARQAAIAMDNARLVGDLRRTLDDLRSAQETLVRGATLRAVGELAAGAAHHLNNLMAVVLGRAQLLLMKKPDAATAGSLRSIERAAADAAETVVRIQGFSQTANRGESAAYDLNAAVHEAIEFTRPRWHDEAQVHGAPVELAFERGTVPEMSGRSAEIREVLTNLLLNALDALPAGGRIVVKTAAEPGRVVVSVTDSGTGMSEDVKRRAFEPFFTTKGVKRTGLGLAVAYGTIRRNGGQIAIESTPGLGTTVTFWLPVGGTEVAEGEPSGSEVGSVLVIDDEADVRELVADVLTGRGHAITVASGGREGLARFETGQFDLVVTDLGMPDLNGWQVARTVKSSHPDTPVLLLTGWADSVHPDEMACVDGVIRKPFDVNQLVSAVGGALAAGTASRK